jgi:CheY-like chemotaxis protein
VLLDMSMPVMGGVDALREIRGYNRQVPVFLCSGFSEQDIGDPARQLNLSGFLQKPYRMLELKRKLREALNGDS